jgi:hypothetical protein
VLLYENKAKTIGNQPPQVDAGLEQSIVWPSSANLDGTVTDDGLPAPPAAVTITWSKSSGPGDVVFTSPSTEDTSAQFSTPGTYVLQLRADDSELITTDQVIVHVASSGQRVTAGLIALYNFLEGGGTTVHDVSGVGTPLDLTVAQPSNVTWGDVGLSVDSPALISPGGPATKIHGAVVSSNAITVEAWINPANVTQDGPARVVTMSIDQSNRNFTLGQGQYGALPPDVINVRLRTTSTDDDGEPSVTTPAGDITPDLTHVVYTRDSAGNAVVYVNNAQSIVDVVGGSVSNWNSGYPLALANELTGDRPWIGTLHLVAFYNRSLV